MKNPRLPLQSRSETQHPLSFFYATPNPATEGKRVFEI